MIEIKFEVDGRQVQPNRIADALETRNMVSMCFTSLTTEARVARRQRTTT